MATIGILSERAIREREVVTAQLQTALDSRVVIEQAKGVIAQSLRVRPDVAFARLRSYCRINNRRLSEVALAIVEGRFGVSTAGAVSSEELPPGPDWRPR